MGTLTYRVDSISFVRDHDDFCFSCDVSNVIELCLMVWARVTVFSSAMNLSCSAMNIILDRLNSMCMYYFYHQDNLMIEIIKEREII